MDALFTSPYMYWVGMNTAPETTPAELDEFNTFYSQTHLGEVVARNPGFVRGTRYELLEPDPRGDFGPRWLVVYEMDGEAAARGYAERNDGPPEARPVYTPMPPAWRRTQSVWRMIWRGVSDTGAGDEPPYSIFMVGMNVPADTDAAGLADFNAFYTDTHVPEVMANGGYTRGTRFELYREFRHPPPGSPRFCAVYQSSAPRRPDPERPKLSSGPPTWENHDTLWRLVYRRI